MNQKTLRFINVRLKYSLLVIFIALGFFLRCVDINNNPKALYGDELTLLYDSYSILHTGMDQTGTFLPLSFPMGADRPPGNVYLNIPFVAIFSLNPLGVRGLSIVSGTAFILLMYLISSALFSTEVGLAAAFVSAFSPWSISMSRAGFETNLALSLALFGMYAFIKSELKKRWFILSSVGFALSILTYPTYRLTIPLFIAFLFLINGGLNFFKRNISSKSFIAFVVVISFGVLLTLALVTHRQNQDRFSQINILTQSDTKKTITDSIVYDRSVDSVPQRFLDLFHNKVISYSEFIVENYVDNFLPDFLFVHGDGAPIHNPATMGELFWVDAVFIVLGIITLYREKKKVLYTLLGWIFITPIATTLVGPPHALRDSFMLAPLLILSAVGLSFLWNLRKRFNVRVMLLVLFLVFLIQEVFFIERVYYFSSARFAEFWNYSAKQASQIALEQRASYDRIIIISSITNVESAYQVYASLNPSDVIYQNYHKTLLNGYEFKKFGNVYLGDIPSSLVQTFAKGLPGSTLILAPANFQNDMQNYSIERGPDSFVTLVLERVYNK